MTERLLAALLLGVALGGIALFLRGDRAAWRSFKALSDTSDRQRRYRRWAGRLWLFLALPALVGLMLLGRLDALAVLPAEFVPVAVRLPDLAAAPRDLAIGMVGGAVVGIAIVVIVQRRRGGAPRSIADVAAMLPRNRAELRLAAALALSAGITEEVGFRLFLPLAIAIVTGSGLAGVLLAVALFGAMHLYQGGAGVAATTAIGAALAFCYLASGALWLAILLHVLIDLGGLVLRPALAGAWRA